MLLLFFRSLFPQLLWSLLFDGSLIVSNLSPYFPLYLLILQFQSWFCSSFQSGNQVPNWLPRFAFSTFPPTSLLPWRRVQFQFIFWEIIFFGWKSQRIFPGFPISIEFSSQSVFSFVKYFCWLRSFWFPSYDDVFGRFPRIFSKTAFWFFLNLHEPHQGCEKKNQLFWLRP